MVSKFDNCTRVHELCQFDNSTSPRVSRVRQLHELCQFDNSVTCHNKQQLATARHCSTATTQIATNSASSTSHKHQQQEEEVVQIQFALLVSLTTHKHQRQEEQVGQLQLNSTSSHQQHQKNYVQILTTTNHHLLVRHIACAKNTTDERVRSQTNPQLNNQLEQNIITCYKFTQHLQSPQIIFRCHRLTKNIGKSGKLSLVLLSRGLGPENLQGRGKLIAIEMKVERRSIHDRRRQ